MPTLQQLRHFQAVIRHGTIHAAAQAVHATQPALTRSIHGLEERLGVKLFERSRKGMIPTPFAEQIGPRLEQLIHEIDDIRREASLYRDLDGGNLAIGFGQAVREPLVRRCVPPFVANHPSVSVRVREGTVPELIAALQRREIDFILAGAMSYRELDFIRLEHIGDIPLNVVVRRSHPLADRRRVSIDEMYEYPSAGTTFLGAQHPLREEFGHKLDPQFVCSDYQTLFEIIRSSDAWLRVPTGLVDVTGDEDLVELKVAGFALASHLSVIELRQRARSPAAQRFVDEVRCQVERSTVGA